ncbi:MAG TPA: hypothetical protein VF017_06555 [Thermoanaerobaculia bacterium]|nr:hypothetical protein [Thermoanaerobaculia bacterium]
MSVHLHIERLVLDGLPLGPRERRELEAALGAELGRLLAQGPLHPELAAGQAVPSLRAPDLPMPQNQGPTALGQGLARSIHGGLAPQRR